MHAFTAPRRAALPFLVALVAACSDGSTAPRTQDPGDGAPPEDTSVVTPPAKTVASIELSGASEVVHTYMGQMGAVARTASGTAVAAAFNWSSSDVAVLTVDPHGNVTARGVGTATITASVGAVSARRQVTVVPRAATALQVTPYAWELQRGDVAHIGVVVLDQRGQFMNDAPIAFSVSDPTIVEVVGGELRPLKAGAVTVTITSGNATATTTLRVAAASRYPLMEVNRTALPAVAFETVESQPHGAVRHQLVVTGGELLLSNSSDRFVQRLVVEEWTVTESGGNRIVTKGARHEQTVRGRYAIDATGHTALVSDEGPSVVGHLTGARGIELVDYQYSGTTIFHFWR